MASWTLQGGSGNISAMGYDLTIIQKRPEEQWQSALERAEEGSFGPLSDERRRVWEAAEVRIGALDPDFEVDPGSGEIVNDKLGMIVSFFETQVEISIAYWHHGDDARDAMSIVAGVIDIVRELSGWSVWDPQLDRELTSGDELLRDGASTMGSISERLPGLVASTSRSIGEETRHVSGRVPWWKFWARNRI